MTVQYMFIIMTTAFDDGDDGCANTFLMQQFLPRCTQIKKHGYETKSTDDETECTGKSKTADT